MDYNQIINELIERIEKLENEVAVLKSSKSPDSSTEKCCFSKGKYVKGKSGPIGAYQLKDEKGYVELYTRYAHADIIINKRTKQKYYKGNYKMFQMSNNYIPLPQLVEETDEYEFVVSNHTCNLSTEEILRESQNALLFDSICSKNDKR